MTETPQPAPDALTDRLLDLAKRLRANRYDVHGDTCNDTDEAVPCASKACAIEHEAERLLTEAATALAGQAGRVRLQPLLRERVRLKTGPALPEMADSAPHEPEVVFHMVCPKGDDGEGPAMTLTQTLDDAAGRQRRYVCPKCRMEITVNFPPAEGADSAPPRTSERIARSLRVGQLLGPQFDGATLEDLAKAIIEMRATLAHMTQERNELQANREFSMQGIDALKLRAEQAEATLAEAQQANADWLRDITAEIEERKRLEATLARVKAELLAVQGQFLDEAEKVARVKAWLRHSDDCDAAAWEQRRRVQIPNYARPACSCGLDAALADPPVSLGQSCCAPAPDRSGRQCDKPKGHDGDHWTYGGNTLTWAVARPSREGQ